MKGQKTRLQSSRATDSSQNPYPEIQDRDITGFEDFKAPYHKTPQSEKEEFRQSIPFVMMGWAKGLANNMSDEEFKQFNYAEKYGI